MTITKQHLIDLEDVSTILSDMDTELDSSMHNCTSCGRDSWIDLREGRFATEVGIMLRKTQKCIGLVRDALKQKEVDTRFGPSTDPRRMRTHENP